jgi:1-acyl-sn-glycerol-3-phosphate acyltransferase
VNYEPAPNEILEKLRPLLLLARAYHDHEVVGLEHVPTEGPVLMAVNHSLASYDIFLLCGVILDQLQRVPTALGDNLIFRTPTLRRMATAAGVVPANPINGEEVLRRGRLVIVAPGGMREALRPGEERYKLRWDRRKGFVRLALRSGSPIQLAACPNADRMYRVYENSLTKLAYKRFKIPLPFLRGWGPSLLPRPVKLVHLLSEPLHPEPVDEERFTEQVDDWHATVCARMEALMEEARGL